jgi:hypothetical protein
MDAAHLTFNILKKIEGQINKKVLFVSELTPDRSNLYQWIPSRRLRQVCYQVIKAIDMSNAVKIDSECDLVFIFEHKPWYSYLLYFNCIILNKPVFFIVHGLQQTYHNSFFHRLGFSVLLYIEKKYKFFPIHLERTDKGIPGIKKFSKSIVIPHPLDKGIQINSKSEDRIKIGILGIIREDKPILPLIDVLTKLNRDDIEILIGTSPYSIPPDSHKNFPFRVVDTSTYEAYHDFINSTHIIINNFSVDQFYFRPSGIINDSISGGCYVIAPNYPVFKTQISTPVTVGELFDTLEDIPTIIERAIVRVQKKDSNFIEWRNYRSEEKLLNELSEKIMNVI